MKRICAWLFVVLWAGLIFYMSSQPAITTSSNSLGDFIIKKTAHVVEFSILASLVLWANLLTFQKITGKIAFWTWVGVVCFAISDEIHQSFVPSRQPRFRDVVIDSSSALVTIIFINKVIHDYRTKHSKTIG